MSKITIKDIAQKLDLNFSSVSRALNNKPGVSEETRKLVMETAKEMGYRPNVIARGLVSNVTKTLGILMPDIINPLFGEITTAIIETANENDYDVFLCISNWSNEKEISNIHTILQKQVDGIIAKAVSDENSKLLEEAGVPVIGYESWAKNNRFSSVSTDNEKGGYIAAEHLIDYGYRKTGIINGPVNSSAGLHRSNGFNKAYKMHSLKQDKSLLYNGDYNIKSGYKLARKLLKEHPDCDSVFAGNDVIALGVLQYLEEKGIKAGRDFGVIGFDNISFSHLPQIRLTTIKQPKYSIGRIMTKLLLDEIKNKNEGIQNFPQRILLEPELIVRSTTCNINPL
jgi:LacI family transcriptional regulator, galactose operon repressor